jgi:hypothetical protein
LVSPVTTGTPAALAALRHRFDDPRQIAEWKTFLENETGGQVERPGAHNRNVVDRAVHRQATDVAAREEQRRDDMRIGGHHQPAQRHRQHGRVVALPEIGVAQPSGKQLLDQLRHRPPTATMRHVDPALPQVERPHVALAHAAHCTAAASAKRPNE